MRSLKPPVCVSRELARLFLHCHRRALPVLLVVALMRLQFAYLIANWARLACA